MNTKVQTMAYLHARGLDVGPGELAAGVKAALARVRALYYPGPGEEGLTAEEVAVARSGGLEARPRPEQGEDPLAAGVMAFASLVTSGLTTLQVAERLGVSDARIRQRLKERSLLGLRSGRSWRLPVFQFTPQGELPGWGEVCARLPESISPVAVERWLAQPHVDLGLGEGETPTSPRQWLLEGRLAQRVADLAAELG
jgi:excisionase family DNA binding protein